MKVEDYLDHLFKLGMGWLGWSEEQTLDTSMPAIMIAYDGRMEMLQSIFGGGEAKAEQPKADDGEPVSLHERLKSAFRALKSRRDGKVGI